MNLNSENDIQLKVDAYLDGSMSAHERLLFEKQMEEDHHLKEEVRLQQSIHDVLFNDEWAKMEDHPEYEELAEIKKKLRTEEYEKNAENIRRAGHIYAKKKKEKAGKERFLYFSVAAVVSLLIASVFIFPRQGSLDGLYTDYADWDQLTSYAEQSETQADFTKGETLYRDKKYAEAIRFFEAFSKDTNNDLYAASLIYLGASHFGTEDYDKAIEAFDVLINSDTYDSSKGHWYKLLVYLKQKDRSNIEMTIQTILSDRTNYNYGKVLEIQESL